MLHDHHRPVRAGAWAHYNILGHPNRMQLSNNVEDEKVIPIPKYVRMGGHTIRIEHVPDLIKTEEAFGTWDDGTLTISIDAGLSSSLKWEVLFHELLEAICTACDFPMSEDAYSHTLLQTQGLLLHQAFQSFFEQGNAQ